MSAPVERFAPSDGVVTGWLGVAMAAVVGAVSVVTSPDVVGLRILLGSALVGVLIWMVVLRPRAAVYDDVLLLRQETSDTWVPLTLIDTVRVGRDLAVAVDERRYHCTGISRGRPSVRRRRGGAAASAVRGTPAPSAGDDRASYVENRIRETIAAAHRRGEPEDPRGVRRQWAVPELAALALLTSGLVISLLVG